MSAPARLEDVERATRLAAAAQPGRPVRVTLEQILAVFGEREPTAAARRRVAAALDLAGARVSPDVATAPPGAVITISARTSARPPLGLVLSGIAVLIFIIWIASAGGGGDDPGDRPLPKGATGGGTATSGTATTPAASPTPSATPEPSPTPTPTPEFARIRIKPYTRATICVEDARRAIVLRDRIADPINLRRRRIGLVIERGRVRITQEDGRTIRIRNPPASYVFTPGGRDRRVSLRSSRCGRAFRRRAAAAERRRREREAAEREAREQQAQQDDETTAPGTATPFPSDGTGTTESPAP